MSVRYSSFPRAFEIQTVSYCNAHCVICPYGDVYRSLPRGVMPMELFTSIIDQVQNPWGMRIIPYLNSEPLLDPLLIERLRYVNHTLPGSEIELSTNVARLDEKMQEALCEIEMKELRLSVFGFTPRTHKRAMPLLSWGRIRQNLELLAINQELRQHIGQISVIVVDYPGLEKRDVELARKFCQQHYFRLELWGFMDRCGHVRRYSNNVFKKKILGCSQQRPLDRMHITHTGQVVLCCMDWRWMYVIGDVCKNTIQEIWDSQQYCEMRDRIYGVRGEPPEICQRCILAR